MLTALFYMFMKVMILRRQVGCDCLMQIGFGHGRVQPRIAGTGAHMHGSSATAILALVGTPALSAARTIKQDKQLFINDKQPSPVPPMTVSCHQFAAQMPARGVSKQMITNKCRKYYWLC